VGRQPLPVPYRRVFDVVTCAGGLGTNLLPASCFDVMLTALAPDGFVVFTVSQKHLGESNPFGTGYKEAIDQLLAKRSWKLVRKTDFVQIRDNETATRQESFSLFVFQKL